MGRVARGMLSEGGVGWRCLAPAASVPRLNHVWVLEGGAQVDLMHGVAVGDGRSITEEFYCDSIT